VVVTPNLVTGQVVKQAETDIVMAAIRAWRQIILDLLLAQQPAIVPGGFALAAATGTPIVVTYSAGVAVLSGYDLAVPAGSFTLAAANATFHRYDLLTVAYSQTTGADSAGQATTIDTATPTPITGTPSATPSLPSLPVGSVQLGWVDVPPAVTSATQCVIHPVQGPLVPNNLQDLTNHLAAMFNQANVLHGFLITAPGGNQPTSIAQTNAAGKVGYALQADGLGSANYPPGAPGAASGDAALIGDAADGSTARAQTIKGSDGNWYGAGQPGSQTASAVIVANASGQAPDSAKIGGHRQVWGRSTSFIVPANSTTGWTATLDDPTFTPTRAVPGLEAASACEVSITGYATGSVTGTVSNPGGASFSAVVNVVTYA